MSTYAKEWQYRQLEIEASRILEADKRKNKPKKKNQQQRIWPDQKKRISSYIGKTTGPGNVASCECKVLPWEDCEHSEKAAQQAMNEMLK